MDTSVATPPAATTTEPAATPAKRPVLTLTEGAVKQVREVMTSQGFDGYFLTIRVIPAGCSGLGYDLNLVKESKPGDLLWEQDGIKLCTDPISAKYVTGTEVDYLRTDTAAGFKFQNPNAKSSCGCGTSFST